jgi:hypothetical protein
VFLSFFSSFRSRFGSLLKQKKPSFGFVEVRLASLLEELLLTLPAITSLVAERFLFVATYFSTLPRLGRPNSN